MDCSVVASSVEEFSKILTQKLQKARKKHRCGECRKDIHPGQIYELYTGVQDGSVFTAKTCISCVDLRSNFFRDGYMFGYLIDDFKEHISDCDGDISEAQIASLQESKEVVCGMLEEYWEDQEME